MKTPKTYRGFKIPTIKPDKAMLFVRRYPNDGWAVYESRLIYIPTEKDLVGGRCPPMWRGDADSPVYLSGDSQDCCWAKPGMTQLQAVKDLVGYTIEERKNFKTRKIKLEFLGYL